MAKRKLMGFKHRIVNPNPTPGEVVLPPDVVDWTLRPDSRVIMHQITVRDTVSTPDGDMVRVKLKQQADFNSPEVDVAVLVGQAKAYRKNGKVDPQSPELWFYADKFWLKAHNNQGAEYYSDQHYLLYEVQVRDADQLIQATCTGLELQQPQQ